MRKFIFAIFFLYLSVSFSFAAVDYHIGIVTETVSQAEDDLRGAEALIDLYGKVSEGGMIEHLTYPDNFMDEQETTISLIRGLADDPLMRAIIVNNAVPGTVEGFREVREVRPDIILIAAGAQEEPYLISAVADLVTLNDFVARGYLIIKTAHDLGCDTFAHISFPRHMALEKIQRRRAVMIGACNEFGMTFVDITAPDPTSDVGIAGAQQYILENTPEWIRTYGENTAFFCTNDSHTEPLLKQLLTYGGYFIEADIPSPLMGYPGALGLDLTEEAGDFPKILDKVEKAVVDKGGAGRFGTWAYSYGYTSSVGLGQLAINKIEAQDRGRSFDITSIKNVINALSAFTPGSEWNAIYYIDAITGVTLKNIVLLYQDTYIMGNPGFYMYNTDVEIDEKYFYLT